MDIVNKVEKLISGIDEERRSHVEQLINENPGYFTAPTATRSEFGGAYAGALANQAVQTCKYLLTLNKSLEANLPTSSLILVGLFHQVGKMGINGVELYTPQESQWHRDRGMMYVVNDDLKTLTIRDRSIRILTSYIKLTDDEYQAILLSEGQYSDENRTLRYRECKLALLLHWAGLWALRADMGEK